MRQIISILFAPAFLFAMAANALVIKDVHMVDGSAGYESVVFQLIPQGYNPVTDSITHVKIIYDFTEIYSDTNQGDEDQYGGNPPVEGGPVYENELVQFGSWMFIWREMIEDVDTGLTVFERDWTRNDQCQFEQATDPEVEGTEYCVFNMDVMGNVNAYVMSYSDNLLLHSITLEVEVDRKTEVSEPNTALLFGLGLLAIGLLRRRTRTHF